MLTVYLGLMAVIQKGRERGWLIISPPCLAACSEVFGAGGFSSCVSGGACGAVYSWEASPEHPDGWVCCCPAAEAQRCPPKKQSSGCSLDFPFK